MELCNQHSPLCVLLLLSLSRENPAVAADCALVTRVTCRMLDLQVQQMENSQMTSTQRAQPQDHGLLSWCYHLEEPHSLLARCWANPYFPAQLWSIHGLNTWAAFGAEARSSKVVVRVFCT
jgi:hypothetical protein